MSEEIVTPDPETIECSMCGRVGGPAEACELCHGNPRLIQPRQYTASEERQGKAPDDGRYGRTGAVGPKVITYLPGSGGPGGGVG